MTTPSTGNNAENTDKIPLRPRETDSWTIISDDSRNTIFDIQGSENRSIRLCPQCTKVCSNTIACAVSGQVNKQELESVGWTQINAKTWSFEHSNTSDEFLQKAYSLGRDHDVTCFVCALVVEYRGGLFKLDQALRQAYPVHVQVDLGTSTKLKLFFDDTLPTKIDIVVDERNSQTWQQPRANTFPLSTCRKGLNLDQITEVLREWTKECSMNHPRCALGHESRLPTRVIDVGPADGSQEPRLYVPEDAEMGQYIALSHCWGGQLSQKTTSGNLEDHRRSMKLDQMPKTFRDAILITRSLHIQYIWIDALCIVQPPNLEDPIALEESKQDWGIESTLMDRVYEDAFLVLAGVDSDHSNVGLLFEKGRFATTPTWNFEAMPFDVAPLPMIDSKKIMQSSNSNVPLRWCVQQDDGFSFEENVRSPWRVRGWTLQEEVLAQRIVYFSFEQFYWSCRSRFWTESGQIRELVHDLRLPDIPRLDCRYFESLEQRAFSFSATRELEQQFEASNYKLWLVPCPEDEPLPENTAFDAWYRLISNYSARSLSFPSDKLTAVYGLAKQHARHFFDESLQLHYTWGSWKQDLMFGMLWRHHYKTPGYDMTYREARNQETNSRAPSWSWASVDAYVEWDINNRHTPSFKILESALMSDWIRRDWTLVISGMILPWVEYTPLFIDEVRDSSINGHGTMTYSGNDTPFINCEHWLESGSRQRASYWLMYCHPVTYNQTSGIFCLMLQRTNESTEETYRRNGWCHLPGVISDYAFESTEFIFC